MTLYPFIFEKNIHPAIWGEESWEVSAHKSAPSIIANGPLAGKPLNEVLPNFPLLFKVITTHARLSVQVHPNEKTALLTGGEPKTEMWHVLNGSTGPIFAGLKAGTTAASLQEAVLANRAEDVLERIEAKHGESYFIPGGLVHAIGENVKVYEVQQNSATTYRLYDWGRVDKDGKPRQLHLKEAALSVDYSFARPQAQQDVKCQFFDFKLVKGKQLELTGAVVYLKEGTAQVGDITLGSAVRSVLIPHGVTATLSGDFTLCVTYFNP